MIVVCDGCDTKYLIGDEKIPENGIRVRCPKCRFVWRLAPPASESIFEVSSSEFASETPALEPQRGTWASVDQHTNAVVSEMPPEDISEEIEISGKKPVAEQEQVTESPEHTKVKERARRQARVFVSDILVYNREKRDKGLANGDLMTVLGPEIKKAWEAYKEKVGSELVESSSYFRDALNEILADGQKVF
jgi:predicted Zn finger-like uncharacterized protein